MADHVLGDVDRDELLAVVHRHRVPHELGRDLRTPRPGLQHLLLPSPVQLLDALEQRRIDVRPLLQRTPHLPLLFRPTRHDGAVRGPSAATGFVALRRFPPRRHRVIALALAFAAAHRMVDRVHDGPANRRAEAAPADPARLADRHVLVVEITHLADRRHTRQGDHPHLAGGQLQGRPLTLLGEELRLRAGAPAELGAAPGLQLDVVHERADRDVPHRQRVARQDVRLRAGHHARAGPEPARRDDIALLAVPIVQQGQPRRAIRVVLDRRDPRRDPILLAAEIDLPEHLLGPAAAMTDRDAPVDVPSVRPALRAQETLLGLLLRDVVVRDVREVASRGRRRLDDPDGHVRYAPSTSSILWPGASVTTAFFQSERRPSARPIRFSFPSNEAVRTEVTLTLNTASTAARISTLLASGRTRKATVFSSSFCRMLFSVISGRIRISRAVRLISPRPPRAPRGRRVRTRPDGRAGADRRTRAPAFRRSATARCARRASAPRPARARRAVWAPLRSRARPSPRPATWSCRRGRRSPRPPRADRRRSWPRPRRAATPAASRAACPWRSSAASGRTACRRPSIARRASSPAGRGRSPSASTACGRRPRPRCARAYRECRPAGRRARA